MKPWTTEASQKTNGRNCSDDLEEKIVNLNLSGDESGCDAECLICGKTYKGILCGYPVIDVIDGLTLGLVDGTINAPMVWIPRHTHFIY